MILICFREQLKNEPKIKEHVCWQLITSGLWKQLAVFAYYIQRLLKEPMWIISLFNIPSFSSAFHDCWPSASRLYSPVYWSPLYFLHVLWCWVSIKCCGVSFSLKFWGCLNMFDLSWYYSFCFCFLFVLHNYFVQNRQHFFVGPRIVEHVR